MTDQADICLEIHDRIRIIRLNRPQAMNAITLAMARRLETLLDDIERDEDCRCIILTGTGESAFSAGFDIKEMADFSAQDMRAAFVARDPLMLRIADCRLPVIAALNGLAYGAGALMAAACDFRIAGPATRFKVTAIGYGSANATWSLPRLVGLARAKEILMTGRVVEAEEGVQIGLFDQFAQDGDVLALALQLASGIAQHDRTGIQAVKRLVDQSLSISAASAWQAEHDMMLQGFDGAPTQGRAVFSSFLDTRGEKAR